MNAYDIIKALVDNSVREHLRGECSEINIDVRSLTIDVEDDSSGIVVKPVAGNVTFLEYVMTYPGSGLNNVARACKALDVSTFNSGRHHLQSYRRGVPHSPPVDMGEASVHGLVFTLEPIVPYFKEELTSQLKELAAELHIEHPGLKVQVTTGRW